MPPYFAGPLKKTILKENDNFWGKPVSPLQPTLESI